MPPTSPGKAQMRWTPSAETDGPNSTTMVRSTAKSASISATSQPSRLAKCEFFSNLLGILVPCDERGRELRSIAAALFLLRRRRFPMRARPRLGRHHLAVEVPSRVPKDRQHYGEPDQERQRADEQRGDDNEAPGAHDDRVRAHRPVGGDEGLDGADVAVEQQRERYHADG